MKRMTQKELSFRAGMPYARLNRLINQGYGFEEDEAHRLEKILDYETSFIVGLQAIRPRRIRAKHNGSARLIQTPTIRKCVFWDIEMATLDWNRHRRYIIDRVDRYGNAEERESVKKYYDAISAF